MTQQPRPYSPARFLRRLAAFFFDYLLISIYILGLVAVGVLVLRGLLGVQATAFFSNPWRADLAAFCVLILPVVLYFSWLESRPAGTTWGKSRLKIRVITRTGQPVATRRALLRSLLKFLLWQIAHTCLFHIPGWPMDPQQPPAWVYAGFVLVWLLVLLYAGLPLFDPSHRTPYDWAAGTLVVDHRELPQDQLEEV